MWHAGGMALAPARHFGIMGTGSGGTAEKQLTVVKCRQCPRGAHERPQEASTDTTHGLVQRWRHRSVGVRCHGGRVQQLGGQAAMLRQALLALQVPLLCLAQVILLLRPCCGLLCLHGSWAACKTAASRCVLLQRLQGGLQGTTKQAAASKGCRPDGRGAPPFMPYMVPEAARQDTGQEAGL